MKRIILSLALLIGNVMTVQSSQISLDNKSITDDEIANAIKSPRPASVTTIINLIDRKFCNSFNDIEKIDLSSNNIGTSGAIKFFDYSREKLPNLVELDLSFNRIRDPQNTPENKKFEKSLLALLELPYFQKLNLKTNYLGLNWYTYITQELPSNLSEKIIWG